MASRASLNKVLLIGNLTRDPELRYTPSGAAVCTFAVATNRFYVASDGTKKEETEFIKIVSWNKLAELCSQLLSKGRKVYVEGRMQTRSWETPDGQTKQTTEIVIDDMRILDSRRDFESGGEESSYHREVPAGEVVPEAAVEGSDAKDAPEDSKKNDNKKVQKGDIKAEVKKPKDDDKSVEDGKGEVGDKDIDLDDLPF